MLDRLTTSIPTLNRSMIDSAAIYQPDNNTDFNSRFLGGRLIENDNREIVLISKTPAEVLGEHIFAPVIEKLTPIVSQVISMLRAALKTPMQLTQSISFPSLLPTVSAQPMAASENPTMEVIASLDKINNQAPDGNQLELHDGIDSSIYVTEIKDVFDRIFTKYHKLQWERLDIPFLSRLRDREGNDLAIAAVKQGSEERLIEALLEKNIGLESQDSEGYDLFQLAAKLGHTHLINLLSDYFEPSAKDSAQPSPMDLAIIHGHEDIFEKLYPYRGATKGAQTRNRILFSSLELSVLFGRSSMFEKLIKDGEAQLYQFNGKVGNLLHLAIHADQMEMLDAILNLTLNQNADVLLKQKDPAGRTPLHLAAYLGNLEAIRKIDFLLDDPNILGDRRMTPLHWAAIGKRNMAVKILCDIGGDPDRLDENNNPPSKMIGSDGVEDLNFRKTRNKLKNCSKKNFNEAPLSPLETRFYPKQLVVSGTGKILSEIDKIQQAGGMSYVSRIGGISKGALTATLLAIGLRESELIETFNEGISILNQGVDQFRDWLDKRIETQTGISNCSFEELTNLFRTNSTQYKRLYLYAQNQTKAIFCAEDQTWRDLIVAEAVAAAVASSTSNHQLFFKAGGKGRHSVSTIGAFFDASNLVVEPASLFDNSRKIWGSFKNRATLELRGVSKIDDRCSERTACCSKKKCSPEYTAPEKNNLKKRTPNPITSWKMVENRFSQIEEDHLKIPVLDVHLPPKDFTGREEELEYLHQNCTSHQRVAITGLGGIGKTALAKKYAEKYRSHYKFIHFVDGSTISEDLLKLADHLNIANGLSIPERLDALRKALSGEEDKFLIIFDRIDQPEKFEELNPLLPDRQKCLLLTSRMPERARKLNFEVIPLGLLKPEDAIDYLTSTTDNKNRAEAGKLASKLGYLPLALTHAASYIRVVGISFEEYLDEFDKYQLELFEPDGLTLDKGEQTILTTWNVSLNHIKNKTHGPLALEVLSFFSSLGQAPISLAITKNWHSMAFPKKSGHSLHRAIGLLSSYSMIEHPTPDTSSVHQLVQKVTSYSFTKDQRQNYHDQVIPVFVSMTQGLNVANPEDWVSYKQFHPHLLHLWNKTRSAPSLDLISMLVYLSPFESVSGNYIKARNLINEFVPFVNASNNQTLYASSLDTLGNIWAHSAHPKKAMKLYNQSLQIRKKLYENQPHPDIAYSYSNLGTCYWAQNQPKEALSWHKKALEMRQALFNRPHIETAESFNNIGLAQDGLNNLEEAIVAINSSIEMQAELFPNQPHQATANYLMSLGGVYESLEEPKEAIDLYNQSLAMQRELFPDQDNALISSTLNNLGLALHKSNESQKAVAPLTESLTILRKLFPHQPHPSTASTLCALADALLNLEKPKEAIKLYNESIQMIKELYPYEIRINTANILINLAAAWVAVGELKEASNAYEKSLAILRKFYRNEPHPLTASILGEVAETYYNLENLQTALDRFQEQLTMYQKLFPKQTRPEIIYALWDIGRVLFQSGRGEEAIEQVELSLEMAFAIWGPSSSQVKKIQKNLERMKNQRDELWM